MPVTINGTTGIAGVDGSAGTPAVQGSDTNTGVYFPAADTLSASTGGTERMRIDSSGNVGIGTSSPTAGGKLDVNGIGYFGSSDKLKIYSNNVLQNAGTLDVGTLGSAALNLITNNATRLTVDASGNVGVGTSSPSYPLTVQSSNAEMATLTRNVNVSVSGAAGVNFNLGALVGTTPTFGASIQGVLEDANNGYMALRTRGASVITERMRIDASGNVGIGTASPTVDGKGLQIKNTGGAASLRVSDNSGGTGFDILQASGAGYVWNRDNNVILFGTNNTERMRIDSSGRILVAGQSAVSSYLCIPCIPSMDGISTIANGTGLQNHILLRNPNGVVGSIQTNGSSTSFNTSSDYRLKEDIRPMEDAAQRVMALKPVNFAWKVDGTRVDGFIAHEAQSVVPEAVSGAKDAVDAEGNPVYQGIDQSKLVPLLTAALQEALTEISSLKARVAALEAT